MLLAAIPLTKEYGVSHFLDRLQFFKRNEESFSEGHGVTTEENRDWEDGYRRRWQHDKIVRSTHGVNCTGSCSWMRNWLIHSLASPSPLGARRATSAIPWSTCETAPLDAWASRRIVEQAPHPGAHMKGERFWQPSRMGVAAKSALTAAAAKQAFVP